MARALAALVMLIHHRGCPMSALGAPDAGILEGEPEVFEYLAGGDGAGGDPPYEGSPSIPSRVDSVAEPTDVDPNSVLEEVSDLGLHDTAEDAGLEDAPDVGGSPDGTLDIHGMELDGGGLEGITRSESPVEFERDPETPSVPEQHQATAGTQLVASKIPELYGLKTTVISTVMFLFGVSLMFMGASRGQTWFHKPLEYSDGVLRHLLPFPINSMTGGVIVFPSIALLASGLLEMGISSWRRSKARKGHETNFSPPVRGPVMLVVALLFMFYNLREPLTGGSWTRTGGPANAIFIGGGFTIAALILLLTTAVQKIKYNRELAKSHGQPLQSTYQTRAR